MVPVLITLIICITIYAMWDRFCDSMEQVYCDRQNPDEPCEKEPRSDCDVPCEP